MKALLLSSAPLPRWLAQRESRSRRTTRRLGVALAPLEDGATLDM